MAERYAARVADAKGNPPDCEFLILKIENGIKRLAYISDGNAKFVERAYIGDPAQYKKLLERGGGGMPHLISTISRSAPALRTTGAG
jgi:hypothetical protein